MVRKRQDPLTSPEDVRRGLSLAGMDLFLFQAIQIDSVRGNSVRNDSYHLLDTSILRVPAVFGHAFYFVHGEVGEYESDE